MSRKSAREWAYKLVFEYLFNREKDSLSFQVLSENPNLSEDDVSFISSIYLGVVDKFDDLSARISEHAKGYSLDRIYKPDLAALMVATYELSYTDTPKSVVISEALELVKAYSTDKSSAYVNGILASIYKNLTDNN